MLKYMSDDRKSDLVNNFNNEVRFYIDPRGIEYAPISGTPAYTAITSTDSATGSYSLSQGNLVYMLPYADPMTVQVYLKPGFAYNVASDQSIIKWYSGTEYLELAYVTASKQFAVRTNAGAGATVLFGPVFASSTQLQTWQRLSFVINANAVSCYAWNSKTTGTLTLSTRLNYPLVNIGGNSVGLINYIRIFSGYAATDADILDGFADVKNEEILFQFPLTPIGRTRCNINTTSDRSVTSFSIERATGYKAASASLSVNNNSGEFSDDQYAAYLPSAGSYNGTSSQRYLTNSVGMQIEGKSLQKRDIVSSGLIGYWGMDNLPEYPDNPAGTTYFQSDWATTDGWGATRCTLDTTTTPGKLRVVATGSLPAISKALSFAGKTVKAEVKKISGSSTKFTLSNSSAVIYPKDILYPIETIGSNYYPADAGGQLSIYVGDNNTVAGDIFEIDWIYVGDGSYTTPLYDNSGGGLDLNVYGSTPVAGLSGNGLSRDAINDYERSISVLSIVPDVWHYHESFPFGNAQTAGYQVFGNYKPISSTVGFFDFGRQLTSDNLTFRYCNGSALTTITFSGFFTGFTTLSISIDIDFNWITGAVTVYRNGTQFDATQYMTTPVKPTAGSYLYFGSYQGTVYFMAGICDERRLYNRALSASEVADLFTMFPGNYSLTTDPQFDQLFLGSIPPGSFGRSTQNGGLSTISLSAEDGIAQIAHRVIRNSRSWENYYLSRSTPANNSVFHEIAYLATKREVYNYLTNSGFEDATITDSWNKTGSFTRGNTSILAGNYCGIFSGTNAYITQRVLLTDISKGEIFTASIYIYSTSAISGILWLGEYPGIYTQTAFTHSGKGWDRIVVSRTIISSATTSLLFKLESVGTWTNVPVDCAMLKYGGDIPFYVENTNSGGAYSSSGVSQIGSEMLGSYDWVGIDADDVSYIHPWAWIYQGDNVWDNMKQIGDACACRLLAIDASGVLRFRSTFGSALPASNGLIENIRAMGAGQQNIQANKFTIKGCSITKRDNVECVWQVAASNLGADAGTVSGAWGRVVADADTIPSVAFDGMTEVEATYGTIKTKMAVF